jgi:hypothetical protein
MSVKQANRSLGTVAASRNEVVISCEFAGQVMIFISLLSLPIFYNTNICSEIAVFRAVTLFENGDNNLGLFRKRGMPVWLPIPGRHDTHPFLVYTPLVNSGNNRGRPKRPRQAEAVEPPVRARRRGQHLEKRAVQIDVCGQAAQEDRLHLTAPGNKRSGVISQPDRSDVNAGKHNRGLADVQGRISFQDDGALSASMFRSQHPTKSFMVPVT